MSEEAGSREISRLGETFRHVKKLAEGEDFSDVALLAVIRNS